METQNEHDIELFEKVAIGAIYRHFKGKEYKVLHIGHHSETLEQMVVYQALYSTPEFGPYSIWVRPLKMFVEKVEVDGQLVDRFALTHESNPVYE